MSARQGARGPARGRVQKQRNNSSRRRQDTTLKTLVEPNRWARMDWLRVNSARHGQRMCGLSALVDEVTVQRSDKGVHFGGLMTCGSRTCPSCGPAIAAQTRREIEQAIGAWVTSPTRKILFGTFTIRHHKGQSFAELAAAISACWGAATGGRGWMQDREQHGIAHHLRVFEQKWSQDNGWHIHVHALFFVDDTLLEKTDHSGLLKTMFKRWASKAISLGMGVPLIRAQDLHEVSDIAEAIDRVAGYFAKESTDAGEQHPRWISAEMANGAGKQGLTSLTPGQILAWAMLGDEYVSQLGASFTAGGIQGQEYARLLYNEFEVGMKGRRSIAWSRGMREALGLGAELTDAELQERQEAADAVTRDTLVSMDGQGWRRLNARPGRRAELYTVAQTLDPGELVNWLAGFGVVAIPHRRDRDSDSAANVFFADLAELPF